jgi:hypothetical protein
VYWFATGYKVSIFGFDFFLLGLTGALHAASVVVALQDRRTTKRAVTFSVLALTFIVLASVLGAVTPILGLWGSVVWLPIAALRPSLHNLIFILITGSAMGSAGYWVLVRRFWMRSLGRADFFRTVALCVAATVLVGIVGEVAPGSVTRPEFWGRVFDLALAVAWWFGFSISLYWSELNKYARKATEVIA